MSYLKDREIWLSSVPTGNPPAGYVWVFIQNGVFVVRDSNGVDKIMATTTGTVTNATSASYVEYSNVANKPALISSSAQIVGYNVFATTGSNQFNGSQAVTGSLTVTGQVVAQTLNVQQVTSSIVFSSGSNIFGNSLSNTQQFTGSVSVTGSLTVVTAGTELQVTSTGVNLGNALTDSHIISGSLRVNPNGLFVSGSGVVGIGTTNPEVKLQIVDTTQLRLDANASGSVIQFWKDLSPTFASSIGNIMPGGSLTNDLIFSTYNSSTSWSERLRITSGGSVGIGATPSTQNGGTLAGSVEMTGILRIQGASGRYFTTGNGLEMSSNSIYSYNRGTSAYNDLSINDSMVVKGGNGNVGIGTASPIATLEVNSSVRLAKLGSGIVFTSTNTTQAWMGSENWGWIGSTWSRTSSSAGVMWGTGNNSGAFEVWTTTTSDPSNTAPTNGNSKLIITNGGNVGIGTTSPEHKLDVRSSSGNNIIRSNVTITGDGQQAIFAASAIWSGAERGVSLSIFKHAGITNPASYLSFYSGGNQFEFMYIDDSGVLRLSGNSGNIGTANGTVVGTQTSDIRLKNVKDEFNYGLNEILQINPIAFTFKKDENQVEKLGFSAQEMINIIPESVYDTGNCVDGYTETDDPMVKIPNSEDTILGMDYSMIIPVLVKAIQELKSENDNLKSRLEVLEQS